MKTGLQGGLVWVLGAIVAAVIALVALLMFWERPVAPDAPEMAQESGDAAASATEGEDTAEAEKPAGDAASETAEADADADESAAPDAGADTEADPAAAASEPETDLAEATPGDEATASEPVVDLPPVVAEDDGATLNPSFNVVRVAPDGAAVVAGSAPPMSEVDIQLDGETVATAVADANGDFVALFDIEPVARPRVMQLAGAGGAMRSASSIIIDAMTPREQMADAGDAPDAQTSAPVTLREVTSPDPGAAPDAAEAQATEMASAAETPEAPEAPRVLRADQDGIEVISDSQPPEALSLDTISYDEEGGVQVAGRAPADTTMRVYLDNELAGEAPVDAEGRWSLNLSGVLPGLYTLRVDGLGADGTVSARVESPFKREDPADLVAAAERAGASATPDGPEATDAPDPAAMSDAPADAAAAPDVALTADAPQGDAPAADNPPATPDGDTPVVATATPGDTDAPGAPDAETADTAPNLRVLTVQPGNTLWAIAQDRYGEGLLYVQVFEANRDKIRDPDLIYPGQVFDLPE